MDAKRWTIAAGLAATAAAASAQPPLAPPTAPVALSVMTYNIEGLPFPVRRGRAQAAERIAAQLRAMRQAGTAPHLVVLQEAFGRAQKAIGAEAGYPYVAFGPGIHAANDEPQDAADRAFAAGARHLKGEADGKWAGSGLAILSDYPILSVRGMPFPRYACAGLDCLANKGVMLATVAVPGSAAPVSVVATHMNSQEASGVAPARYGWAYDRQVRSIGRFLTANLDPAAPYVFAGDTNIGRSPTRTAAFTAMLAALPRTAERGEVRTALATCLGPDASCSLDSAREARRSFRHGKDWQVYAPGAATALRPVAIATPFGHDANGAMLSDHIGYTAVYRVTPIG